MLLFEITIYNGDLGSVLKNLDDTLGSHWEGKGSIQQSIRANANAEFYSVKEFFAACEAERVSILEREADGDNTVWQSAYPFIENGKQVVSGWMRRISRHGDGAFDFSWKITETALEIGLTRAGTVSRLLLETDYAVLIGK